MESFHNYMIDQLREYILTELKRGASWEEIERALYNAGHEKNVIDEAFSEIKKEKAGIKPEKPKGDVENDLVSGAKIAINNFFGKLKSGKDVDDVKEEVEQESTDEIIDEAVSEAQYEEQTYVFEGYVFFLYLLIITVLVFFTAGATDDDLILIVLGLSPTFINAVISFALVKYAKYAPMYVLIPIAASSLFYALARFANISLLSNMDYESLAIVNAILGMLFNVILINMAFMRPSPKKKEVKNEIKKKVVVQKSQPEQITLPDVKQGKTDEISSGSIKKFQSHIDDLKKEFNIKK